MVGLTESSEGNRNSADLSWLGFIWREQIKIYLPFY